MEVMEREERELREAVMSLAPMKQSRRFDGALARRIVAHAERRLARGGSVAEICKALDISHPTLTRMLRSKRSSSVLVPVEVRDAPRGGSLVLREPCGVVVEGSVDDLAAIIARLACSG